ncbi:hypothetical protein FRB91_003687 [Serendipita sp. 411]|nr:hypothetical protein FRC18_004875 [Serendipita sp. 400]KAG8842975.1 hypothetical protein FRB91_003687 [Serendipita sp. 411]
MHFVKVLILPVVLALTISAAPVPAPIGNMVTLETRCHGCPHSRNSQRSNSVNNLMNKAIGYKDAAVQLADKTHELKQGVHDIKERLHPGRGNPSSNDLGQSGTPLDNENVNAAGTGLTGGTDGGQ